MAPTDQHYIMTSSPGFSCLHCAPTVNCTEESESKRVICKDKTLDKEKLEVKKLKSASMELV